MLHVHDAIGNLMGAKEVSGDDLRARRFAQVADSASEQSFAIVDLTVGREEAD